MVRLKYLMFLILLWTKISYCQQEYSIAWENDCPESIRTVDTDWPLDSLKNWLFEEGYPYAALDTSRLAGSRMLNPRVSCGPKIGQVRIRWTDSTHRSILSEREVQKTYPWPEIVEQRQRLMETLANAGYPYARLFTNPVAIRPFDATSNPSGFTGIPGDTLVLEYSLDTLRRIYIQEVTLTGEFSMNQRLFETMTGIHSNEVFNLDRIEQSKRMIRQWDFAELKELEYDFNPYGVNLNYAIASKNPSRFDLLIALVPSNQPNKQYEITGNAFLDIRNQLKMAERIYLKFDKYANTSQSFDLRLNFPYLPLIRTGVLAEGLIDRRDSTTLDVHGRIGLQYRWNIYTSYAFFLQRDQSRLITIPSRRLMNSGRLPKELDYNYSAAGVSLDRNTLNNPANPRKGSRTGGTFTGGIKKMIRNAQILGIELPEGEIPFSLQYDSLSASTAKIDLILFRDQFIPLGAYSTMRLRGMGGWVWSSSPLFENEEKRLGGFQDFRGFPEKAFRTDIYGLGTVEYRFLFGAESNIYLFSDFGFLHQTAGDDMWNFPHSVGVGLNLGTKAGVFGISYAVGGQRNQSLSLDQSRVNFGLVVNY